MVSYEVYKIIHVLGIMILFLSIGALFYTAFNKIQLDKKQKRPWLIMHGVSLFLILLGGFGLLARIGISGGFPTWVWLKIIIWGIFGGLIMLIIKLPQISKVLYLLTVILGFFAIYIANYKPFL